ncbi:MAG: hypothetical protein CFE34_07780 [Rhodobacteraceae bacterium PARR1]|nr:MAG: hypothetical protein CFE34_07780 [Rhodobacteraceae bacterium PARR1]
MTLLILGLVLWTAAHLFKRIAPDARAGMGERGKLVATVLILLSIVLMYYGYKSADGPVWWPRNSALVGINNLLMLLAFYLYAASGMKTAITRRIRHPQLTAVKVWALAHLLVNGDLPSFVLFGGILAWAVASVILINRAEPVWTRPAPQPVWKEGAAIVGALVVTGLVMGLHNWLGYQPWG